MVEEKVTYEVNGTEFEGVLVYDESTNAKRPAVLTAPNWMGVTPAAVDKAKLIAGNRYVIFVADMYGVGTRPTNIEEASAAAEAVRSDIPLMRARINGALDVLIEQGVQRGVIDKTKTAGIGFCFGGGNVLELARSGRNVVGVVSFHGNLTTPNPEDGANIQAKILALHGADDPLVPKADRDAFEAEMKAAGTDWQLVAFGGAVHSFTDPGANRPNTSLYDEKVTKRAYGMMHNFFSEIF
jgi:dienelactone hydrolase